jgi:hypothetical protein
MFIASQEGLALLLRLGHNTVRSHLQGPYKEDHPHAYEHDSYHEGPSEVC